MTLPVPNMVIEMARDASLVKKEDAGSNVYYYGFNKDKDAADTDPTWMLYRVHKELTTDITYRASSAYDQQWSDRVNAFPALPIQISQLDNLEAWYELGTGVLNGSDASASDGEDIKTIQDQSGKSRDVTQATVSDRPLYTAANSSFNDVPTVTFDANNTESLLDGSNWSPTVPHPFTVIQVIRVDSDTWMQNTTRRYALESSGGVFSGGNGGTPRKYTMHSGGAIATYHQRTDDAEIHIHEYNGSSSRVWVNGEEKTLTDVGTMGTTAANRVILGAGGIGSFYCSYEMAEFAVTSDQLTSTEIEGITTNLKTKYGIA